MFPKDPLNVLGFPFPVSRRRVVVERLDAGGIPVVCTTGLIENLENEGTADYGINPCVWNALPCRTVILWKVRHPVSENGASLAVNVVVPSGFGSSTVTPSGSVSGTSKIPVVDNKSTQVEGRDVTVPTGYGASTPLQVSNTTEHWVYIDKSAGVFRLLGVTAQASPARSTGGGAPAQDNSSAVKSK